jgi:hypothetical protein
VHDRKARCGVVTVAALAFRVLVQGTCAIMMRAQLKRMRLRHYVLWCTALQLCRGEIERAHVGERLGGFLPILLGI